MDRASVLEELAVKEELLLLDGCAGDLRDHLLDLFHRSVSLDFHHDSVTVFFLDLNDLSAACCRSRRSWSMLKMVLGKKVLTPPLHPSHWRRVRKWLGL